MDIFKEYANETGRKMAQTKCATCTNAIWRIIWREASEAEVYDKAPNCCLAGHCTALGSAIKYHTYECSAYAQSDAAQGAELAGML